MLLALKLTLVAGGTVVVLFAPNLLRAMRRALERNINETFKGIGE